MHSPNSQLAVLFVLCFVLVFVFDVHQAITAFFFCSLHSDFDVRQFILHVYSFVTLFFQVKAKDQETMDALKAQIQESRRVIAEFKECAAGELKN